MSDYILIDRSPAEANGFSSVKIRVLWDVARVVTLKFTDISKVRTTSIIALMMEAVCTSETLVNFNMTTRRYIPEDSNVHTRRCVKSHDFFSSLFVHTSFKVQPIPIRPERDADHSPHLVPRSRMSRSGTALFDFTFA
jgi:hypothetical protein